jgi:hypothetical protein
MLELKEKLMVLSLDASFSVFRNIKNYEQTQNKITQHVAREKIMYTSMRK